MASISANGSKNHHKFTLNVTNKLEDTSVKDNASTVSFSFVLSSLGGGYNWEQWGANITYTITINGVKYTGSIANYDGYSDVTLKSGSFAVGHNSDGNKTISFSFSVSDTSGQSYTCGNASASGTMALATIPRYLSINSLTISNITETTAFVNWSVSSPRDSTYYSLDNGVTWIGSATDGETLSSDLKSGTFNLVNLTANKTYNIKVKIKRTDSQLWTESEVKSFTTYNYPYCSSAPNFTIGNEVKIDFYNPLGRSLNWQVIGDNGSVIGENSTTGTSHTGLTSEGAINNLYKSIPKSKSGTYTVKVTYGNNVATKTGGTYSIKGNEVPTIGSISYLDSNSAVVAITGDSQQIVQNKSNLRVSFSPATANYGASGIVKYVAECNGATKESTSSGTLDLGVVDSASKVNLKFTVFDSRGLSASTTIAVNIVPYEPPKATVELRRLNNYEDETYLTVDSSYSRVNGKNTVTIKYRYKVSGGNYGSYATIPDGEEYVFELNKNNAYIFEIVVTDAFGSTFTKEYALGKGVFPLFIDTEKNSVGINCFPTSKNSFEVEGSAKTAHFCGIINSAHWYYIGDFTFNGQGTCAVIDCYTGKGQNGGSDQNTHCKIILKQGWDGEASPIGVTTNFTQNYLSGIKVKISHTSKTGCKLYIYLPFNYNDLSYSVDGSFKSFTASNTVLDEEPTTDKESHYYNNTNQGNKVLWSGGLQMNGSQTVTLSEAISAQPHGIVLVFSRCDASNGTPLEWGWTTHFVPKEILKINSEKSGQTFMMSDNAIFDSVCCKYLYIGDTAIGGNANNVATGTKNGITYANNAHMLRTVIGV